MSKQAFDKDTAKRAGGYYDFDPTKLIVIGVDEGDKTHPLFDARVTQPLSEETVLNFMTVGIRQNITVVKDGDGRAIVVAGRRRVLHAREANKRLTKEGSKTLLVPAKVIRGDEKTLLGIFVSENEIREDDLLTAKAEKAQRLIDYGYDVDEVALLFGVTTTAVNSWLKLLDLSAKVRKAVDEGTISASAAAKLASLSRDEQNTQLDEMIASGKTSTAEASRRTRNKKEGKAGTEEEVRLKPKTRLLKRVLTLAEDDENPHGLDPGFVKGIQYALGLIDPSRVKGLTALVREAEKPKEKKTKEKDSKKASDRPKAPKKKGK